MTNKTEQQEIREEMKSKGKYNELICDNCKKETFNKSMITGCCIECSKLSKIKKKLKKGMIEFNREMFG